MAADALYIKRAAEGTRKAQGVVAQVLAKNSLDEIDVVSGATCSFQCPFRSLQTGTLRVQDQCNKVSKSKEDSDEKILDKMCSLVLLLFLIGGYNTVLAMREQRDEIARLTAELEGSKMTVSALKEQQAKTTENTAAEALKGADAKNTDGGWKDGTYEGEGQGFGGKVVVEVTIESGEITCIEVKEAQKEDSAYLEMAKDIIEDIVDAQSADVDTISGATFSSTGIREAVTQALEKAE